MHAVHTVGITEFCCHNFVAKIPSNQLFTKELYSKLIWRKKFCVAVNFSFFHTAHCGKMMNYSRNFCGNNGLKIFTIKHIFLICKLWFFAWICLRMAKVNQLVHESVYQNQLSNPKSTQNLRSTQGVDLTNFDTISSILLGTYDKILLYEIGKWFIINIFYNMSDKL